MRLTRCDGRRAQLALAAAIMITRIDDVLAHGFAGERFFPATILTDDPFVADEMSLPHITDNLPGPDGSKEIDFEFDIAKRITPNFGLTISDEWQS